MFSVFKTSYGIDGEPWYMGTHFGELYENKMYSTIMDLYTQEDKGLMIL